MLQVVKVELEVGAQVNSREPQQGLFGEIGPHSRPF